LAQARAADTLARWHELTKAFVLRSGSMPLHARISQLLVDLIEGGDLANRLLAERELAELLGVSLAPVRQAILDVVNKGLIERRRGRGPFVRGPGLDEKISILHSFTENIRTQHVQVDTQVLSHARLPLPQEVARALGLRERTVMLLERVAIVGREPVALLRAYLSLRAYPQLLEASFANRSLYGFEQWRNEAGCWELLPEAFPGWPWTAGLRHLVDCVEQGTPTVTRPEHTYRVLEVMLAAARSSHEGRAIESTSTFPKPDYSLLRLKDPPPAGCTTRGLYVTGTLVALPILRVRPMARALFDGATHHCPCRDPGSRLPARGGARREIVDLADFPGFRKSAILRILADLGVEAPGVTIGERDVANPAPSRRRAAPLPATKVAPENYQPHPGQTQRRSAGPEHLTILNASEARSRQC